METEISIKANVRLAKKLWSSELTSVAIASLERVIAAHSLSIVDGDLIYLAGKWYVTHTGLLRVALRNRCAGIEALPVTEFCDPQSRRWAFTATVYKTRACRGFVGYGDADPSNVSPLVHGAEMRVAETRAVNRALRKAYGIGICSVEEIGSFAPSAEPSRELKKQPPQSAPANGKKQWWSRASAITSARSSDNTNSIPSWSRPMPSTSAAPRLCVMPPASKSRTSSSTCRLGAKRPQRPALPTQQLPPQQRGCRMKRRFAGLQETDSASSIPDGIYLVQVQKAEYRWHAQNPFYILRLFVLDPRTGRAKHFRSTLLYAQSSLEAGLVLARFPLRPGLAGQRRD